MQEFGPKYDAEVLQNKKRMEACDVLVFVYDSGDVNSFGYIANLRNRFNIDDVPCVIVATKSDCDLVQQVRKFGEEVGKKDLESLPFFSHPWIYPSFRDLKSNLMRIAEILVLLSLLVFPSRIISMRIYSAF